MISVGGNRGILQNARELLEPDSAIGAGTDTLAPAIIIGGFSVARPKLGMAVIDLKDGYQLAINDTDRRIVLENKTAKSSTIIWGDASISTTKSLSPTSAPSSPVTAAPPPVVVVPPPVVVVSAPTLVTAPVPSAAPPLVVASPPVLVVPAPPPVTTPSLAVQNAPLTSIETPVAATLLALELATAPAPAPVLAPTPQPPLKFWGTISFTFGNDQKITLNTLPAPSGDGSYTIDKITVTSGSNGLTIGGAADQTVGALNITAANGYDLDEDVRDGLTLEECVDGTGWKDEEGVMLSQLVLNATAVGADFGPGSKFMSMLEMSTMISRIFSFNFINVMTSSIMNERTITNQSSEIRTDNEKSSDRRRVERLVVDQILAQQAAETRRMENDKIPLGS